MLAAVLLAGAAALYAVPEALWAQEASPVEAGVWDAEAEQVPTEAAREPAEETEGAPEDTQGSVKESEGPAPDAQEPVGESEGAAPEAQEPAKGSEGQSQEAQEPAGESEGRSPESQEPAKGSEGQSPEAQEPAGESEKPAEQMQEPDKESEASAWLAPMPMRGENGRAMSNDEAEWDDAADFAADAKAADLRTKKSGKEKGSVKGTINADLMALAQAEWIHYSRGKVSAPIPFYYESGQSAGKTVSGSITFHFSHDKVEVVIRNTGKYKWKEMYFTAPAGGSRSTDTWVSVPTLKAGKTYRFEIALPAGVQKLQDGSEQLRFLWQADVRGAHIDLLRYLPVYIVPPGFPGSEVPVGDPLETLGEIDAALAGNGGEKPGVVETVTATVHIGEAMAGQEITTSTRSIARYAVNAGEMASRFSESFFDRRLRRKLGCWLLELGIETAGIRGLHPLWFAMLRTAAEGRSNQVLR